MTGSRSSASPRRGPIRRSILRVESFFLEDIWASDADALGWPLGPLYKVLRIAQLAWRGVLYNRSFFTASALTYITVLSLVPMLAFAFSVAKGMGAYDRLREGLITPFLDRNLGALSASSPEAIRTLRETIDRILELVSNTNVSSLGTLGLVIVVLAVIRVLGNVEDSFNKIWGVRGGRSLVRRIADYLSLAVVTPLLLVLAVAVTAGVQNSRMMSYMLSKPWLATMVHGFFGLAPLLSIWISFSLVYIVLPNTRIRLSSALLGGIVGGSLWHLAQLGHVKFQIGIANYNAIYSSFAAIPIFLVWLYVSWVTVMFGAEFAHAHQMVGHHRRLVLYHPTSHRQRQLLALRACVRIAERFITAAAPWTLTDLVDELEVAPRSLQEVLQPLIDAGLLREGIEGDQPLYVLGRDPKVIRISDVLESLRGQPRTQGKAEGSTDGLREVLSRLDEVQATSADDIDLQSLAESMRSRS